MERAIEYDSVLDPMENFLRKHLSSCLHKIIVSYSPISDRIEIYCDTDKHRFLVTTDYFTHSEEQLLALAKKIVKEVAFRAELASP